MCCPHFLLCSSAPLISPRGYASTIFNSIAFSAASTSSLSLSAPQPASPSPPAVRDYLEPPCRRLPGLSAPPPRLSLRATARSSSIANGWCARMRLPLPSFPAACSTSGPATGATSATPLPPSALSPSPWLPCLSSTSASIGANSPVAVMAVGHESYQYEAIRASRSCESVRVAKLEDDYPAFLWRSLVHGCNSDSPVGRQSRYFAVRHGSCGIARRYCRKGDARFLRCSPGGFRCCDLDRSGKRESRDRRVSRRIVGG